MMKLLICKFDMDTGCMKSKFSDGTVLAIDCNEGDGAFADAPAQRAELDWLLHNKPLEYAQLVLGGEMEHSLALGCDHGILED